ncbi:MAG: hypothetical protein ABIM21_04960, partial [candidate division WOR-3 bacterium]
AYSIYELMKFYDRSQQRERVKMGIRGLERLGRVRMVGAGRWPRYAATEEGKKAAEKVKWFLHILDQLDTFMRLKGPRKRSAGRDQVSPVLERRVL